MKADWTSRFPLAITVLSGLFLAAWFAEPSRPVAAADATGAGPAPGTPAAGHVCDRSCGHIPAKALERLEWSEGSGIGRLVAADVGSSVRIALGPRPGNHARVFQRSARPDGRVAVGARLEDGAILYVVSDGDRWE
ncbi:MAG: hypothetical protein HKO57_09050, partial [Akkermansiaceae bacterium]|nr:hypothetical protein [Akkermansiaceae bacterium]